MNLQSKHASLSQRIGLGILNGLAGLFVLLIVGSIQGVKSIQLGLIPTKLFGVSVSMVSTMIMVTSIITLTISPLAGFLSDLFGRRKFVLIGLAVTLLGVILLTTSRTYIIFLISTLTIALGTALALSPATALFLESGWFIWITGTLLAFINLTESLSSTLATTLAGRFSYSFSDLKITGFILIGIVITFSLLVIGLYWGSISLSKRCTWSGIWLKPQRGKLFNLIVPVMLLAYFFSFASSGIYRSFSSLYYSSLLGISAVNIASTFLAFSIASMIAGFISGPVGDLFNWLSIKHLHRQAGYLVIVLLGMLIFLAGYILLPLLGRSPLIGIILVGAGIGLYSTSLRALVIVNISHRWWGVIVGGLTSISIAANMSARLLGGIFVESFGIQRLFTPAIIILVISILLTLVIMVLSFLPSGKLVTPPPVDQEKQGKSLEFINQS
ncbi:MAG TPA: MFS transporter [Anaerolineaceae bacterium]